MKLRSVFLPIMVASAVFAQPPVPAQPEKPAPAAAPENDPANFWPESIAVYIPDRLNQTPAQPSTGEKILNAFTPELRQLWQNEIMVDLTMEKREGAVVVAKKGVFGGNRSINYGYQGLTLEMEFTLAELTPVIRQHSPDYQKPKNLADDTVITVPFTLYPRQEITIDDRVRQDMGLGRNAALIHGLPPTKPNDEFTIDGLKFRTDARGEIASYIFPGASEGGLELHHIVQLSLGNWNDPAIGAVNRDLAAAALRKLDAQPEKPGNIWRSRFMQMISRTSDAPLDPLDRKLTQFLNRARTPLIGLFQAPNSKISARG